MKYDAVVFDVDGTLAESKMHMTHEMGALLARLAALVPIAATSGTDFSRFKEMVFPYLPADMPLAQFHLMPTSGSAYYLHDGSDWKTVYEEKLSEEEMEAAERALEQAIDDLSIDVAKEPVGPIIERRYDTMVAFAGLGHRAPLAAKQAWDPDRKKRNAMRDLITPLLPWAVVRPAGTTTIDITRRGIEKDHGVRKFAQYINSSPERMLYVGDALYDGGNDAVVKVTGIETREVRGPADTARIIEELLSQ